jgi:hypothetical protein
MVPASPGGSAGAYGYWVQPAADGYSGLLFPDGDILVDFRMDSHLLLLPGAKPGKLVAGVNTKKYRKKNVFLQNVPLMYMCIVCTNRSVAGNK